MSTMNEYEQRAKAIGEATRKALEEAARATYLEVTPFDGPYDGGYEVGVDGAGVVIYSECCADRMSEATARKLYHALGQWLADRPA